MMTGFSEPSLLEQARQAGAMDILRKPFRMRDCWGSSTGCRTAVSNRLHQPPRQTESWICFMSVQPVVKGL